MTHPMQKPSFTNCPDCDRIYNHGQHTHFAVRLYFTTPIPNNPAGSYPWKPGMTCRVVSESQPRTDGLVHLALENPEHRAFAILCGDTAQQRTKPKAPPKPRSSKRAPAGPKPPGTPARS